MYFMGLLNLCNSLRQPFGVRHPGVVVVLETPQGSLIKVPQHVSSEDYSSALSQRDAQAVVANLLGIVAAHRGVQHAPLAMLASQTKVFLTLHPAQRTIVGPRLHATHTCCCKWFLLAPAHFPHHPLCTLPFLTLPPTSPPHPYPPYHLLPSPSTPCLPRISLTGWPCLRSSTAMQSHLAAMDTNETTQYQANTPEARGLPKAAAFVLECLARLPQALQVALGQPILLQPLAEVSERLLAPLHVQLILLAVKQSLSATVDWHPCG